jgi:hypothetical protein
MDDETYDIVASGGKSLADKSRSSVHELYYLVFLCVS